MYYRVLVASRKYHGNESLTYSSEESLTIGQIVRIPLGKIHVIGIVADRSPKPAFAAKAIIRSWEIVVPSTTIDCIQWLHSYYPAPLGSITELFTPPALPQNLAHDHGSAISNSPKIGHLPKLTPQQSDAVSQIQKAGNTSVLLHGDTGTGKTRIYLEIVLEQINKGRSVIITTPEIGLTKPLVKLFTEVLGSRVFVTHSGMTPAVRRTQWLAICNSTDPVVIIGPRSALFAPVGRLGAIIIDEAHDTAYKQDQAPYYQSTRVAAKLASLHKAQLILGTATPLVADYYTFKAKNLPIIRLTQQAITSTANTKQLIIDTTDRHNFTKSPYLSNQLLESIAAAIEKKQQSLLFLNRRGSARLVLCQSCGWRASCPHCDTSLTFHADTHSMQCHSCDFKSIVPNQCPDCQSNDILFKSIGTKALEEEVSKYFPGARIARFDGDTHQSQGLSALFDELREGEIDILIGTQAIAKGFDLPKLSVVGIVQADMSLSIPDYTATERTYQLISQVAGRIGRGHTNSTLIVQTHAPHSPIIRQALTKNYSEFYESERAERQAFTFPPFVHIMTVTCTRASSKSAESASLKAKQSLLRATTGITVDGPTPRFLEKVSGKYSWHIILKAKSRSRLIDALQYLPAGCIANPDPSDLL